MFIIDDILGGLFGGGGDDPSPVYSDDAVGMAKLRELSDSFPGGFWGDPMRAALGKRITQRPPRPPDLTDQAVRLAKVAQRKRLMLGQGLGGTFVSGSLGDTTAPATSKPALGGY